MKLWLPMVAALGLGIAVVIVVIGNHQKANAPLSTTGNVPRAPFPDYVAGAGVLEASTQNIAVGTPVPGIVSNVYVRWGDRVKTGDSLFRIDDRDLRADLVSAAAKVRQSESVLANAEYHLHIAEKLGEFISREELVGKRYEVETDRATAKVAKAQAEALRLEMERRIIRAPIPGRVLGLNVHPGEFASSEAAGTAPIILGNDDSLFIRVEVDEHDAWRVRPGAQAVAFLRSNSAIKLPVSFVRIEPRIVPKTLLTGRSAERSDVRVLQVIYGFNRDSWPVYVGQEMDVYIEAPSLPTSGAEKK